MSHLLLFVAAASIAVSSCAGAPAPAYDLAVEYVVQHTDPVTGKRSQGPLIDIPDPRFSWVPVSSDRGAVQASYRIIVNKTDDAISTTVWDSGITSSNATSQVVYGGSPLVSSGSYSWSVLWTDGTGAASGWAEPASFSTGLLTQGEWAPAAFITCGDTAANQLRAEFIVPPGAGGVALVDAQLLITGMGYYRAFINGARLGRTELDPAWTTYPQRLLYSGYNVLSLLSPAGAPSALAVYLGNGWPNISPNPFNSSVDAGDAGFTDGAAVAAALDAAGAAAQSLYAEAHPGAEPVSAVAALRLTGGLPPLRGIGAVRKLRAQLRLTYADGSIAVLATTAGGFADASAVALKAMGATPVPATWRCAAGALIFDDVYDGCTWDARAETVGWDLPGYAPAAAWPEAVLASDPGGVHGPAAMTAQTMPPVSIVAMLPALTVNEPSPGVFVLDFGQNFAGYVRLRYPAPVPAGVNITLRHAELLQHPPYGPKDGSVYTGNLRSAKATDVYTTRASPDDDVLFEPLFTYHGFRYVEVSGMPLPVTPDMLTGLVFRSAVAPAGALTFPAGGDAPGNVSVLNQLQHAVTWGQASNLMSVPSDCPQRDERKGWMGDSGLSQETMHMNFRMCAFHTKWAADQRDAQTAPQYAHPVGAVPDTVPWTFGGDPGDPAWMTSYPGAVYWLWRHCGDTRAPAAHWPNMRAYVDFQWATLNGTAGGMKNYYSHYSDWCPPPEQPGGGQGAKPSGAFTSASAFVGDVAHLIELADALGEVADAATWRGLHATLVSEYNTAFYNAGSANYGNANGDGLQTANSIALALGVVPTAATSAVAAALDHDVTTVHGGHWFTGISGMRFLCRALTAAGFGKTAVDLLLPLDYPSFGFWFNNADEPATTMNELPDMSTEGPGMNSRCDKRLYCRAFLQQQPVVDLPPPLF